MFPRDITAARDNIEETLRAQRLNVGFSRAKETIHFVLSKPVNQFQGTIGQAIAHYYNLLTRRPGPDATATDPRPPMEKKILDWIQKTAFYQRHQDDLELIPQFPVGDYLRQLDPTYQHPRYRVDFLLRYNGGTRPVNVIIEYDGFQEHFTEHGKIHAGNYPHFYRPSDVERQMVLESYGYKFLRINRFTLGRNEVETLSGRLTALFAIAASGADAPSVLDQIRRDAETQANGKAKHCSKCGQVKSVEKFFDRRLGGGTGGYGRICVDCKRVRGRRQSPLIRI